MFQGWLFSNNHEHCKQTLWDEEQQCKQTLWDEEQQCKQTLWDEEQQWKVMFLTLYEIFEDIKVIFRANKSKKDSRFNDQKKTKDDQGSTNNCTVNLRLNSTQRCDLSRGRGYTCRVVGVILNASFNKVTT